MIPDVPCAVSARGPGVPGRPIGARESGVDGDPVEIVARRVGAGTDEATRERALRVALVGVNMFAGNYRPELHPERLVIERWLAAAPGSPEREKLRRQAEAAARTGAGRGPYFKLCDALNHAEPGRCAGGAVADAAREGQAVSMFFIPNLLRALGAAGFGVVEDL